MRIMIEIRQLTIEDLDGLIKLLEQLWPGKSIDANAVKSNRKRTWQ
jgi:hypothetical protein